MAHDLILMEFYPHYIRESKTKGYNPISSNVFHFTLMRFHFKKSVTGAPYTTFIILYILEIRVSQNLAKLGGRGEPIRGGRTREK